MPTDPNRQTRLHDLKVREVSLVDHPANEETFLLIKRIEGAAMLRTDTPLIKAAKAASDKNEAEKTEQEAAEKAEHGDMGKIAMMAMDYAKALLGIDHSKMAESDEFKSLMAALEQLASAASAGAEKAMGGKDDEDDDKMKADAANKGMGGKYEEKEDEEKAEEKAEAKKMDHGDKKDDEEEKAEKADAPAAPAADQSLTEIRDLLAQLHSKLGPAADAQKAANEEAVAKGLNALTERLDRISDRISTVEKTRGVSRGEGDTKTTNLEKGQSLFAGLI